MLIDNALSPLVAERLAVAGHDVTHVRDYGLAAAPDAQVFDLATREDRVIVSADTDFGALLALWGHPKPSFVLLRRPTENRPEAQVKLLLRLLADYEDDLLRGSILTVTESRVRIRELPIR